MFLSYDTIGYLKGPDIALVKDVETGTVAVRKKLRAELLGVYERLKSEPAQGLRNRRIRGGMLCLL